MDERASTLTVLMDVSAARRETDERIARLAEKGLASTPSELPDGLKPYLQGFAAQAISQLLLEPTWANTLYAAAINTIATDPETEDAETLRAFLVQVASVAVNWIEVLDERKNKNDAR